VNALLQEIGSSGRDLGGVTLNSDFLTGGLFSYDGIHLTDLGYAVLANEWIGLINRRGGSLPLVNLGPYFGLASTARGAGRVAAHSRGAQIAPPLAAFEFSQEAVDTLRAVFPLLERR
jgi:hypothetical protein